MSNARNIASGAKFVDTAGDSMTGDLTTTGKIGIGTNSPTGTVHISSSAPTFFMTDTTNNTEGVVSMDNAGSLVFNADLNNEAASSNIRFLVDGTEHMRISAEGRVTMPNQPAFHVIDLAFSTGGSSNGTGGTVKTNRGSRYSAGNGRFTAPVAGVYYFWGAIQHFQSGSSTYIGMSFYKNGSQDTTEYVSGVGGSYNNHQMETGGYLASLNVNDYVNINANRGARNGIQSAFLGYLIG